MDDSKICRCGHSEEMHNGLKEIGEGEPISDEDVSCKAVDNGFECGCEEFEEAE